MEHKISTILLYLVLICIFGFIIGQHMTKVLYPIKEGARTLPRPVINPIVDENTWDFEPSPPYQGETINQMIDRYIAMYFNKEGVPYVNTIQLYSEYCVNKGNVSEENKRKLTDIGYYFLNIVIPNIPKVKVPKPLEHWPPIQYSNQSIFNVLIRPTPTYEIYKGQYYDPSYISAYTNSNQGGGRNIWDNFFGDDGVQAIKGSGESSSSDGGQQTNEGNTGDCNDKLTKQCGYSCPNECLKGSATAWARVQEIEDENRKKELDGQQGLSGVKNRSKNRYQNYKQDTGVPNTVFLPGGTNTLIIGSTEVDGYRITDEEQTSSVTTLNDQINMFIKNYFIESGPNKGKPTQKAINLFNAYFQYKQPMDDIHMNKLRDVVYYFMQVIIPGLPTQSLPRSYVEWRPIVWLSRSEKTN